MKVMTETSQPQKETPFEFRGNGAALCAILAKNFIFTIFTLGIYSAWGRTNLRRYIWGHTFFKGEPIAYTGTGEELFKGWVKLLAIFIVIVIAKGVITNLLGLIFGLHSLAFGIIVGVSGLLTTLVYIYIYAIAVIGGTRYRLSRTQFRNISCGLDKDKDTTKAFIKLVARFTIFTILTLGLYIPYGRNQIRSFLVPRMRLGNAYLSYNGPDKEYFWICITGFIFTILTLGLWVWVWGADIARFILRHTRFHNDRIRFDFTLTGMEAFKMGFLTLVGMVFSFGLATPWLLAWNLRVFASHITTEGEWALEQIEARSSTGEAMGDVFLNHYDIDLGFF